MPPLDRFEWERLIRDLDLPSSQKLTAYALGTFMNRDGTNAHPGTKGLMKATGLSKPTILTAVQELEKKGLIRAISKGGENGVPKGHATVWELSTPCGKPAGRHRKLRAV